MEIKSYFENGLYLEFGIIDGFIKLLQIGNRKEQIKYDKLPLWKKMTEIEVEGRNQNDHHFAKHTGSSEGETLKFKNISETNNAYGKLIMVEEENDDFNVKTFFQFFRELKVIRTWKALKKISKEELCVTYFPSFVYYGLCKGNWEKDEFFLPHNSWMGECQWDSYTFARLGLQKFFDFGSKRVCIANIGSWSTKEYLPMGIVRSAGSYFLWQIEHNGSWNYEISTLKDELYLHCGIFSERENGFYKNFKQNDVFITPNCTLCFSDTFDQLISGLNEYRRKVRVKHVDQKNLPVIFNDYMNCLMGDPTTENEIPMIEKAAEIGCETYCIDCGWYGDGDWWSYVGEWLPSERRFPNGLQEVIQKIKQCNMKAGLWVEIEVIGINSPAAKKLPEECFIHRRGKRIIDHGRYILDFTSQETKDYCTGVIDRLVKTFGIEYLKMDYNVDIGIGSGNQGDSFGEGLYLNNLAYLDWLDNLLSVYPQLTIENCASGGCRMDFAMVSRCALQSSSDQTDYRKYSTISANLATAVSPEQAAVWSYPLKDGDENETIYNMVNCLLFRIHQSGNICEWSAPRINLVKNAIQIYKEKIRPSLASAKPVFPIGLAKNSAPLKVYGIDVGNKIYLAVWANKKGEYEIDLSSYGVCKAQVLYPNANHYKTDYSFSDGVLTVNTEIDNFARIFEMV